MTQPNTAPALIGIAEPYILGVDNGGTNTTLQLRRGDDILQTLPQYDTPHDYDTAVETFVRAAETLTNGHILDVVGFSVAGEIRDGKIVRAGQLQEYGWKDRPLQADVTDGLGIDFELAILLNDCVAAAKAQQVHNRKVGGAPIGYAETISTGFGGAGFDGDRLIEDEPGHEELRPGAICGCKKDGCAEAHISGSGIERKFGISARDMADDDPRWPEILTDMADAHANNIWRFDEMGFRPDALHLFGSVALKRSFVIPSLIAGLEARKRQLPFLPGVVRATHGDHSGIVGAGDAAYELVRAA